MNDLPLFDGPVGDTRLEYVIRREGTGDYLAKLSRGSKWRTGLGPNAVAAVAAAIAQPLRSGTVGELTQEPAPDETGPEATAQGCPA